jgi:predicted nucleic acid-binding protein
VNNTPLVALWSIDHLPLLRDLYGEILIPQTVHNEFLATEHILRQETLDKFPWIKPITLTNPRRARVYIGLDQGEAEVLALADELSARLVIIDERRGRRYAKRLGIPLTGTLGVLLAAKDKCLVPAVTHLIDELLKEGLHLAPDLVAKVLGLAGEQ